jgi:hypothetical protein
VFGEQIQRPYNLEEVRLVSLDDLGDLPRDDVLKQMPERPVSKQERDNLQRKGQARGVRSVRPGQNDVSMLVIVVQPVSSSRGRAAASFSFLSRHMTRASESQVVWTLGPVPVATTIAPHRGHNIRRIFSPIGLFATHDGGTRDGRWQRRHHGSGGRTPGSAAHEESPRSG